MTRERANELKNNRQSVITAYQVTKELTPQDTINALIEQLGHEKALIAVAECVNATPYDGRIYRETREWAKTVKGAATTEELESYGFYDLTTWIHTSHLNQIAEAMMKL